MKNIFGGCFGAFQIRGGKFYHEAMPVTTVTDKDADQTRQYFLNEAYQFYPSSQGWYDHYAGVAALNESQVRNFLES